VPALPQDEADRAKPYLGKDRRWPMERCGLQPVGPMGGFQLEPQRVCPSCMCNPIGMQPGAEWHRGMADLSRLRSPHTASIQSRNRAATVEQFACAYACGMISPTTVQRRSTASPPTSLAMERLPHHRPKREVIAPDQRAYQRPARADNHPAGVRILMAERPSRSRATMGLRRREDHWYGMGLEAFSQLPSTRPHP
jgi:hypothetical protein